MKLSIIKKYKSIIFSAFGIFSILIIWFILSRYYVVVPSIHDVIIKFFNLLSTKRIYSLFFKMIFLIIITLGASFIVAILLGVISYLWPNVSSFINPIITLLKTIPVVAIIILLFLSIGTDYAPYVATSFVIIPLIYENTINGLNGIDNSIIDDIKTVSNINFKVVFIFYIPYIIPNIITSTIQSFGLGLKVMLMTEYMSPNRNTFGAEIRRYYEDFNMEAVYAIVLLVLIMVFITDVILKVFRKKYSN